MNKKETKLTTGLLVTLWNMGQIRAATDPHEMVRQAQRAQTEVEDDVIDTEHPQRPFYRPSWFASAFQLGL